MTNNHFKALLLKISTLPNIHQRWILQNLSPQQHALFQDLQGSALLSQARRFGKWHLQVPVDLPTHLPPVCHDLADKPTQFKAIILQQGNFPWEQEFLQQQPDRELMKQYLSSQIKTAASELLFTTWQAMIKGSDANATAV